MAINFPTSPTLNDVHTDGENSWKWNGTSWVSSLEVVPPIPSQTGQAGEFLSTDGSSADWISDAGQIETPGNYYKNYKIKSTTTILYNNYNM